MLSCSLRSCYRRPQVTEVIALGGEAMIPLKLTLSSAPGAAHQASRHRARAAFVLRVPMILFLRIAWRPAEAPHANWFLHRTYYFHIIDLPHRLPIIAALQQACRSRHPDHLFLGAKVVRLMSRRNASTGACVRCDSFLRFFADSPCNSAVTGSCDKPSTSALFGFVR